MPLSASRTFAVLPHPHLPRRVGMEAGLGLAGSPFLGASRVAPGHAGGASLPRLTHSCPVYAGLMWRRWRPWPAARQEVMMGVPLGAS